MFIFHSCRCGQLIDPDFTIIHHEVKGKCLITNVDIKKGTWVDEYIGEIFTTGERYTDSQHYAFKLKDVDLYIDPTKKGNHTRFISCDRESPNLDLKSYATGTGFRAPFMALRDIQAGEELTFDYGSDFIIEVHLLF